MDTVNITYPALAFPAPEISAFAVTFDVFILSLKNGKLINFKPHNADEFYHWLTSHNIRDIDKTETKKEKPPVSNSNRGWRGLFKQKRN